MNTRHELIEGFLKNAPVVRNNTLFEAASRVAEALQADSLFSVKDAIALLRSMQSQEIFESRVHGAKWVSQSQ